ncbi:HNH endonuclease [Runella sp.]|jgi:5-methylcytosine-specific restriction endonuclease McrA|uniref:HNH endonuclease n=1 Tax=Runella sp. TaxID=1960881 RepID=UPI00261D8220|nr:HNH endonuclease [Runella sp.]
MRKLIRTESPEVLTKIDEVKGKTRWQVYGELYAQNRAKKPSFEFQWPQIEGKKLNQHLLPKLMAMTDDHCSYCDGFPLKRGDDTIDHFHPKTRSEFYSKVCDWENLYLSCKHCQDSKGSQYEVELLRPDELDFHFNRYFIADSDLKCNYPAVTC